MTKSAKSASNQNVSQKLNTKSAKSTPNNGQLIVIEGASDGIGKTTQYKLLLEYLKQQLGATHVVNHHFPTYYAYQGKGVEKYLSGDYGSQNDLSPYFINNLYAYDRMITWQTKLQPEFNKGKTILLDRYTTSSMIYQTALFDSDRDKANFLDYIDDFEHNKLGIRRPDTVIFLYAPLQLVNEIRAARQSNEGNIENDIHEHDLEYLEKVYNNAMFVAQHSGWQMINCANADSTKILPIDEIQAKIRQALSI